MNAPLGCRDCSNTIEPYANDGDGPYRTGDQGGRCATCNSSAVCACCDNRFPCEDPSDPDNLICPGCAAETGAYWRERRESGDPVNID
jgi:hypothetical protein